MVFTILDKTAIPKKGEATESKKDEIKRAKGDKKTVLYSENETVFPEPFIVIEQLVNIFLEGEFVRRKRLSVN